MFFKRSVKKGRPRLPDEEKTKPFNIRLYAEDQDRIKDLTDWKNLNISKVTRLAIRELHDRESDRRDA